MTHAGFPSGAVAASATQHVALELDSIENLYVMRDRIRSKGIWVMGPWTTRPANRSTLTGLEGLVLEITAGQPFDPNFPDDRLHSLSDDEIRGMMSEPETPVRTKN